VQSYSFSLSQQPEFHSQAIGLLITAEPCTILVTSFTEQGNYVHHIYLFVIDCLYDRSKCNPMFSLGKKKLHYSQTIGLLRYQLVGGTNWHECSNLQVFSVVCPTAKATKNPAQRCTQHYTLLQQTI
jgi:hypothetical protein